MTFLELCQNVRREARLTGTGGPTQVKNQQGILGDIVEATRNAWIEIQSLHKDWRFLEGFAEGQLVVGENEYVFGDFNIIGLSRVKRILLNGRQIPETTWDRYVEDGANGRTRDAEPSSYILGLDGHKLIFNSRPTSEDRIDVQYFRQPVRLSENADTPNIQEQFQWVIVWSAVADLAANESDSTIYQKAFEKYDNLLALMAVQYLPNVTVGGAFR